MTPPRPLIDPNHPKQATSRWGRLADAVTRGLSVPWLKQLSLLSTSPLFLKSNPDGMVSSETPMVSLQGCNPPCNKPEPFYLTLFSRLRGVAHDTGAFASPPNIQYNLHQWHGYFKLPGAVTIVPSRFEQDRPLLRRALNDSNAQEDYHPTIKVPMH